MKNKILVFLGLCILALTGSLSAELELSSTPASPILEFRVSDVRPLSSSYRKIFHHNGFDWQFTASVPLLSCGCDWLKGLNVYGAIDYSSKHGRNPTYDSRAHICVVPVTAGLKYFFPALVICKPISLYVAGGLKYFFLYNRNHYYPAIKKKIEMRGLGGVFEGGFLVKLDCHWALDIFTSYSFKTFSVSRSHRSAFNTKNLDISTLNIGAGIGYIF